MSSVQWNVRPLSPGAIHYLPAGTYYIGDPQYALSEHDYEQLFTIPGIHPGHYMSSRGQIVVDYTFSGPNQYVGMDDKIFHSDSGLIAIISESLVDYIGEDGDVHGGQIYDFLDQIEVICCGGVFTFTTNQESIILNTVLKDESEDEDKDGMLDDQGHQSVSMTQSIIPMYGLAHGRSHSIPVKVAAMTPISHDVYQLINGFGGMDIE
jgi:hypothetical protein